MREEHAIAYYALMHDCSTHLHCDCIMWVVLDDKPVITKKVVVMSHQGSIVHYQELHACSFVRENKSKIPIHSYYLDEPTAWPIIIPLLLL